MTIRELTDIELDAVCGGSRHRSSGGTRIDVDQSVRDVDIRSGNDVDLDIDGGHNHIIVSSGNIVGNFSSVRT